METFTRTIRATMERFHGRTFWVFHSKHEHDRTYTENVHEFFSSIGVECKVHEFDTPGQRPELRQCLNDRTIGILGFNSQLDHCWIDDENFVDLAAKRKVPLIHWIMDHPSSRWPEFTRSTAENSKFMFMSEFSERYFQHYCLADAKTVWQAGNGPNWRSRIYQLSRRSYLERTIRCLIPLNVRRVGGTIDDAQARLQTLETGLSDALKEAIELARCDLDSPIEMHLANSLAQHGQQLPNVARRRSG